MVRGRAMLTDTERELLHAEETSDRYYQAVPRIRRKINEELTEDVELLDELREVVCERD